MTARSEHSSRTAPKFMMRLPGTLHARVKAAAKGNGRSMNGELVHTLEHAYPAPVEPVSVNEELRDSAHAVLSAWTGALRSLGQDADANPHLIQFRDALNKADPF